MTAPARALPEPAAGGEGWPWRAPEVPAVAGDWPLITVVTPSYNQGEYLEACLRSVLLQGYPRLEYIVLDGASSDRSPGIIRRYADHLAWWRSEPDQGQADAIATGLERGSGELACWLNSDDILLPGALHHVARQFAAHPRAGVVFGNRLVIDAAGAAVTAHVWPARVTRFHWAVGQPLAQESCFWRADLYREVGGLDRSRFFTLDHDLFYRMWRAAPFRKTSAFLGCLRVHEETKNARAQAVRLRELEEARARYGLREPGPLRARVMAYADRVQVQRERRRLVQVRAGSDPGPYGPGWPP